MMPNTDTLYVSDLDGTLLGTDSLVSPTSAAIISDLCSRGAMITVATARTPATVVPLLRHTGISMPAIVMTGAATWSIEQGRFIQTHILDSADASLAVETVTRHGITPFIYTTAPAGSPLALEVYQCQGSQSYGTQLRRRPRRHAAQTLLPRHPHAPRMQRQGNADIRHGRDRPDTGCGR